MYEDITIIRNYIAYKLQVVCLSFAILLLDGCAGFFVNTTTTGSTTSTSSSSSVDYVYVANANNGDSGSIAAYSLASSALTAITGSPFSVSYSPTTLAVRPGNDFLFAGSSTTGGIYAYAISSTGALTAENSGDAVASVYPVAMDIDAAGSYLVALLNDYLTVVTYAINTSTGALTQTSSATATTGSLTGWVKLLPDEDYAYVSTGTGGISIFTFDSSTGTIVNTGSHLAGSSTVSYQQVVVDTTSTYLAAVRVGTNAGVDEHAKFRHYRKRNGVYDRRRS